MNPYTYTNLESKLALIIRRGKFLSIVSPQVFFDVNLKFASEPDCLYTQVAFQNGINLAFELVFDTGEVLHQFTH